MCVLKAIIDVSATVAGAVARVCSPLAKGLARFGHLASLRSRVVGRIPVTTQFDGPVRVGGRPRLRLGDHCRLGFRVYFESRGDGRIEIGPHTRINAGTFIVSYASVSIGRDCLIGEYVSIRDANHGLEPGTAMREQEHTSAAIRIGDDCWIGRGAVLLPGVTVGDGAVIGANSVVTRDVPPGAIAVGSPAKVLRLRPGFGSDRESTDA